MSAGILVEQGAAREEGDDRNATNFDGLAPAFFAIHKDEGEGNFSAFALDGIDRLESGSPGGDDIIHDDDRVASLEISFNLFPRAMAFGFLADGEDLECLGRVFDGGKHADGKGDGVRAEGHAADGVDFQVLRVDF